jgi:pantoate--beta-alanine ligase
MTAWSNQEIAQGRTICLVPTMGFFHEGHLSLMRMGTSLADQVVVSLFVNPIQFGPNEDLESYPSDFARDCELVAGQGGAVLFAPGPKEMYPEGFQTQVLVRELTSSLCGRNRPGHFAGVTTVVAKLFHIVKPRIAVFGEKDYQQLAVIRRMTQDLNLDIEIKGHPIVREPDGLAMSSRNSYLSADERQTALCLSQSIEACRDQVRKGERDSLRLIDGIKTILQSHPAVAIEYVAIVDGTTLADCATVDRHSILALAVKVGKTRLIDNGKLITER